MKKIVRISVIFSSVILFLGCDDVLEDNITDDIVTAITPKDKTSLEGNSVQFRWEELDGADEYRVQVVEESTQKSVLDSLVSGNMFTYGLNSGEYSWRVRGENFAYVTAYSFPATFTLTSSDDLAIQTLFLTSPTNNFYTNKTTLILTWDRIQAAATYTVEIDKTVQGSTVTEIQTPDIVSNNFTLTETVLSTDAIYTWKVKAVNTTSETQFSERRILLDTQTPNLPTLTSPAADARTSSTVNFTWGLGSDTGEVQSPVSSVLEISTNVDFTSIIDTLPTDTGTQEIVFSEKGDYYWRVKNVDSAGNESAFSTGRKLTVE